MDFQQFSFKELYSFRLKATYPIEVAGQIIEPGEVIADFDKIQLANFQEIKSHITARGGKYNPALVTWDTTDSIALEFVQGIFSKTQYSLMSNMKYLKPIPNQKELIGEREILETNSDGIVELRYIPHCDVYVYDAKSGLKFNREGATPSWKWLGDKRIQILDDQVAYRELVIDYCFQYENAFATLIVGKDFTNGFLWAEGKTRVQDDETGLIKTGILRIPKFKLMSDLSIRVGRQATPVTGNFSAVAYPTGANGTKEAMRLVFLSDDVDSDI